MFKNIKAYNALALLTHTNVSEIGPLEKKG
jgi:hypothetical protein